MSSYSNYSFCAQKPSFAHGPKWWDFGANLFVSPFSPSRKECDKWFARNPGACLSDLPGPPQLVPQSEAALVGVFEPQVEDIDIFDALRKLPRLGCGHDRRGVAGWRS